MFTSFRIGTLFGFPIRVHWSFLLLLAAVLFWMGGPAGVLLVLMVASSVLVHELGHALLARHLGVPVAEIGLHIFGGAAQMAGLPRRPGDEIAIAAAGPAVSFALAGLGHGFGMLTGVRLLALFGTVNLGLAVFNLLPAFPSDGGRILRAWLARRRGLVRATDLAVMVGRVVCVMLAVGGLALGSFQLVIVAGALWMIGAAERRSARLRGDFGAWRGDRNDTAAPVDYLPPNQASKLRAERPIIVVWRR
jgi:Zn-dependent protease